MNAIQAGSNGYDLNVGFFNDRGAYELYKKSDSNSGSSEKLNTAFGNVNNSMVNYQNNMGNVQNSFNNSFAAQVAMNELAEQQHLRVAMENARSQGTKASFDKISY